SSVTMHLSCILVFFDSYRRPVLSLFFFTATAPTESYTLSLHDALPICRQLLRAAAMGVAAAPLILRGPALAQSAARAASAPATRLEEHTSELQSQSNLVCRLLLEKKKTRHTAAARLQRRRVIHEHCALI